MQHPSAWTTDLIGHRRWSHLLPITARINQLVALILALSFALLADGIEHNQSEPQLSADAGSGTTVRLLVESLASCHAAAASSLRHSNFPGHAARTTHAASRKGRKRRDAALRPDCRGRMSFVAIRRKNRALSRALTSLVRVLQKLGASFGDGDSPSLPVPTPPKHGAFASVCNRTSRVAYKAYAAWCRPLRRPPPTLEWCPPPPCQRRRSRRTTVQRIHRPDRSWRMTAAQLPPAPGFQEVLNDRLRNRSPWPSVLSRRLHALHPSCAEGPHNRRADGWSLQGRHSSTMLSAHRTRDRCASCCKSAHHRLLLVRFTRKGSVAASLVPMAGTLAVDGMQVKTLVQYEGACPTACRCDRVRYLPNNEKHELDLELRPEPRS